MTGDTGRESARIYFDVDGVFNAVTFKDPPQWGWDGPAKHAKLQGTWWKLQALRDHLADFHGPALWIDDDIAFDREARSWLGDNERVVALSPRTELGVTKRQAEIIRRFVAEVATAAGATS